MQEIRCDEKVIGPVSEPETGPSTAVVPKPPGFIDVPSELLLKPVADQIALDKMKLRARISHQVMHLFIVTNIVVLIVVLILLILDGIFIYIGKENPAERLINSGVVKTLIAATTVQLGSLAISMGRFLFSVD